MKLRDYQGEAVQSIYEYFRSGKTGNPLIVLPTGSGKSYVQAAFVESVIDAYPRQRIMLLTHVQELLQQNGQELVRSWPEAKFKLGYYSAGMKRRCTDSQLTIAGIQSVFRRAMEFGAINLIIIDEAHLVPSKGMGMYRQFIRELTELNPKLKVIGMTATPYRLGTGMLCEGEGRIFTHICYDTDLVRLITDDYLAPLVTKLGENRADLKDVKVRGGEYVAGELEKAMNDDNIVKAAVLQTVKLCADRNKWLVFCSGVDHAFNVRDEFRDAGVTCETITGETPKEERAQIIARFRASEIRALTNVNVLTTGFNVPDIDALIVLRPTKSAGLHVQMMGRGMRTFLGKTNCLVLDFTDNILEHGPIDKIKVKKGASGDEIETAPQKECPECHSPVAISARECPDCGHEFEFDDSPKHFAKPALGAEVMSKSYADWVEVDFVRYTEHRKAEKPPSLRVHYQCGLLVHCEWVCIEHDGFAGQKAERWWSERLAGLMPKTTDEALARAGSLKTPRRIMVNHEGKFTRILRYDFSKPEQTPIGETVETVEAPFFD